jgi:hypothetical protein
MAPLSVFVSYAREDVGPARQLCAALQAAGFEPWIDEENLLPGQDWDREIKRALRKSDFCVVCLSMVSVAKRGFVQKEIKRALESFEEFPEGTIYLIPARVDACQIPESLSRQQWVDLFQPSGMSKLLAALQYEAGRRANQASRPASAGSPAHQIAVPVNRGISDQVRRLQLAAVRLDPHLKALADGQHRFSNVVGKLGGVPARWRVSVSQGELLRRLEALKKIADEAIALTTDTIGINRFGTYSDANVGIGPGNVNEALFAFRMTEAGHFADVVRRGAALRQVFLKETWLAEFAPAATQALDQIHTQMGSLQTQIRNLGGI